MVVKVTDLEHGFVYLFCYRAIQETVFFSIDCNPFPVVVIACKLRSFVNKIDVYIYWLAIFEPPNRSPILAKGGGEVGGKA